MLELSAYQDIPHLLAPWSPICGRPRTLWSGAWARWNAATAHDLDRSEKPVRLQPQGRRRRKVGYPLKDPDTLDSAEPQPLEKLPYIVVIIDELADLMMVSAGRWRS